MAEPSLKNEPKSARIRGSWGVLGGLMAQVNTRNSGGLREVQGFSFACGKWEKNLEKRTREKA